MIHKIYTYDNLIYDLIKINTFKKFLSFKSIGKSVNNKDIFLIKAGNGARKILVICGHHSLETIMSEFICDYLTNKEKDFFDKVSFYAIPLLNPDGVDFLTGRINIPAFVEYRERWQANFNGVDLNHNYDAGFLKAREAVENEEIFAPYFTKYGGEYPFSEPETQAVKNLCERTAFDLAIAFHTQGKEIYSGYDGIIPLGTEELTRIFAECSGYTPSIPSKTASHAGFKDWFIKTYNKPAFTIEAGIGKNPLYHSQYGQIKEDCTKILDSAVKFFSSSNPC